MEASPALLARCAVHPDQVAGAGVCPRCGSFMCAACPAPGSRLCAACHALLARHPILRQVQPLAVVLMVHGGILMVGGLLGLVYGMALAIDPTRMSLFEAPAQFAASAVGWILIGGGILNGSVGAWQGWAGWRLRSNRGRGLGISALLAGLLTVFGCYGAPTSVALMIWGMIVLADPAVAERFAAAEGSGATGGP